MMIEIAGLLVTFAVICTWIAISDHYKRQMHHPHKHQK